MAIRQKHIDYTNRIATLHQQGMAPEQIAEDEVIEHIFLSFESYQTSKKWLSEEIALVLESDFATPDPFTQKQLQQYTGTYQQSDGTQLEVYLNGSRIFARSEGSFLFERTPKSLNLFDFKAELGKNYLLFNFAKLGNVKDVTTVIETSGC